MVKAVSSEHRRLEDPGQRSQGPCPDTRKEKCLFLLKGTCSFMVWILEKEGYGGADSDNTDGIYLFLSLNVSPLCDAVVLPRCI